MREILAAYIYRREKNSAPRRDVQARGFLDLHTNRTASSRINLSGRLASVLSPDAQTRKANTAQCDWHEEQEKLSQDYSRVGPESAD